MLTIEGRTSLCRMYQIAHRAVWDSFFHWFDRNVNVTGIEPIPADWDAYSWDFLGKDGDQIPEGDMKFIAANAVGFARQACVDVIKANGGLVEILTPSGALPKGQIGLFERSTSRMFKGKAIESEMFESIAWGSGLLTRKVWFEDPYSLLDWDCGTVDVRTLERIEAGARSHRKRNGADQEESTLPSGRLAMLRPYHGCPIIVPEAYCAPAEGAEAASRGENGAEAAFDLEGISHLPPKDRILAFAEAHPTANKETIKQALFPDISFGQFKFYFRLAADQRPELSKPGRKPTPQG